MLCQLGARSGDELVDLYPGSRGRRQPPVVGERSDTSPVDARRSLRPYDLAAVCSEQALVCPVNGARCESIACIDVGCTAVDANVEAGGRREQHGRPRLLRTLCAGGPIAPSGYAAARGDAALAGAEG